MLEIIDRSARRCVQNEALIRYRVNNILFAVLDTVTMSALDDAQPLNPSDPSPFYSLFAIQSIISHPRSSWLPP
jgi:hypothetical protein